MNRSLYFLVFICALLFSCDKDHVSEPLPVSPYIELYTLEFFEGDLPKEYPTLDLKIKIRDKEGDLGFLSNSDIDMPPYHQYDIVVDANDQIVTYSGQEYALPFYGLRPDDTKYLFSNSDDRPSFSCDDYDTLRVSNNFKSFLPHYYYYRNNQGDYHGDTIYIIKNPNYFNVAIDYILLKDSREEILDWKYVISDFGCGLNFYGHFYNSGNKDFWSSYFLESSFGGHYFVLNCPIRSLGFRIILKDQPFKLRISILDRALNRSNVLETEFMTLDELLVERLD